MSIAVVGAVLFRAFGVSKGLSDADYARLSACPTNDEAARQSALESRRPNGDIANFLTCDQIAQFKSELNPQ